MSQSTTYLIIAAVLLIVIGVPLLVAVNRENVRQTNGAVLNKVVFVGLGRSWQCKPCFNEHIEL